MSAIFLSYRRDDSSGYACGEVIAMIGPNWIKAQDGERRPRPEDPHDFICLEINTALTRGVRVIPVLVHNARMPLE